MEQSPKKPKLRMVKREPPSLEDVENFSDNFCKAIESGDYDVYLDVLWVAVDSRMRAYFDNRGKSDNEQERRAEKIRRMRTGPEAVSVGQAYNVYGDRYSGIQVVVDRLIDPGEDGLHMARVRVVRGSQRYPVNSVYKLPVGGLEEIPGRNYQ